MAMPKGGSGFKSYAGSVAAGMTKGSSRGFLDNAADINDKIRELYQKLYRNNSVKFDRDSDGNVTKVHLNSKVKAQIDALANMMSQNTVEYDRQAHKLYLDLKKQFDTKTPVFIRLEDSKKRAAEQVNRGNFKIKTAIKNVYKINGVPVKGDTFRQNTMRERYEQVMGSAAVAEIESRRGQGGTTDVTWLNAANKVIDDARNAVYTRRNDNSYSSDYFSTLLRGYADVSRNAESRRK